MGRSAGVIVVRGDSMLLLRRGPTAPWMPCKWNLPGGMVERGEQPEDAARREALEEAGLEIGEMTLIAQARVPELGDTYYAYITDDWTGRVQLDSESCDFRWLSVQSALKLDLMPPLLEILVRHAK